MQRQTPKSKSRSLVEKEFRGAWVEIGWGENLCQCPGNLQPWRDRKMSTNLWEASLITQLVENPLAMQETLVWPLGWEDPLEKGKATLPVFWPGKFHGLYSPWGHRRVRHDWVTFTSVRREGPQGGCPHWETRVAVLWRGKENVNQRVRILKKMNWDS